MTFIDGFERKPIPDLNGGTYVHVVDPKYRLVLHTTEGSGSIDSYVARYRQTRQYPHITADPRFGRVAQHVSLDRSVTTAKNQPGGVETNRLHAIQIEIIGFAKDTAFWTDEVCEWLGAQVIAPIVEATAIQLVGPPRPWVDQRDGFIARPNAPQRMSAVEWTNFNGVCGHQHLPENDHWDPGRLREDVIFDAARAALEPEDDLPYTEQDLIRIVRQAIKDEASATDKDGKPNTFLSVTVDRIKKIAAKVGA